MKPCPFCGSGKVEEIPGGACVCCSCGSATLDKESWNTRPDSTPRPWLRAEEVTEPGWYWHAPGDLTMHARRAIEPNGGRGLIVLIGHFYAPIGKCRHAEGCTCALGGLWQRIPEPELPKEESK